jgi:two-component system, sensor histidine kinase
VRADRSRMEQVLSNLLDNALKFTPPGKAVHIRLGAARGEVLLDVRDEGEGLSAGMQQHAFELFVQGEHSLDRARGGLGIGLALVKRIVEMHAGRVEAASEGRGKGASFRVVLPAVRPGRAQTTAQARAPAQAKPRRVLLVEDNDDTRRMVSTALAHAGHEVIEARDGGSALSLAAEREPDAVLLDIGLPDLDGYEVARRLRADDPARRTLLIALTGYGQKEDRERAVEAGFDLYLTKPLAPDAIERALEARA